MKGDTATPPKFVCATRVSGRSPEWKFHTNIGHGKNAMQNRYGWAKSNRRELYMLKADGAIEDAPRWAIPEGPWPTAMPWENEREELLKVARRELARWQQEVSSHKVGLANAEAAVLVC